MPLFNELVDLDQEFHSSKTEPIILNDLHAKTEDDRDYYSHLVEETFTSDVVSVLPRCQCPDGVGGLKGEHLVGEICDICGTAVKQTLEESIAPSVWFRRPSTVEKLINPIVLIMLGERFTRSNYRVLQWILDRHYNPSGKRPEIIEQLVRDGIPRGYNTFVQNFDSIMAYLFEQPIFRTKRSESQFLIDMLEITHPSRDPLQQLLAENRGKLFSDFLPVMNRSLLVLEQTAMGLYHEKTIIDIRNALNTMLSIDQDFYDKNPVTLENRTARILFMLADYYRSIYKKNLDPKEGLLRKHGFGSRTNLSFRAVVTSHEDIHDHDEIYIPWSVGVTMFQLHLHNRLMDRKQPYGGMTHNEAMGFLYTHVHRYHPMLDELFQRMIRESRHGGLLFISQRNPSLMKGSAQLLRATKFKTDPDDKAVSMSDLVATSSNTDYDGKLLPS